MIILVHLLADDKRLVAFSVSLRQATIAHRLAHDGVLVISIRLLRRLTVARPEALVRVASPGQAQLQIFNLALRIRPQINHMKLHEHSGDKIYRQACISHALNFSLYFLLGNMPVRCTGRENSYHDSAQPGEKTHITTRRNAYYSFTFCLIQLFFLVLVFQSTFVRNLF
jgi:hypothetical protein